MKRQKPLGARYTPEQQQEDLSIAQLRERMANFGWLTERTERDIGEDLIIRILTQSNPVGVPFYAQIKSVKNLDIHRREDWLAYRLEVADVVRWETSQVPVVLFIWDVTQREGRWQLVRALTLALDESKPSWRAQKTVTVYLTWANSTDDDGLYSLKNEIGEALYPLIADGREPEVRLEVAIPNTEDAAPARIEFERFVREGTPVVLEGQYIRNIEFSAWWAEWFDHPALQITAVEVKPGVDRDPKPASISLVSSEGHTAHFPYVELRVVRRGTGLVVLSNEGQRLAVTFTLMIPLAKQDLGGSLSFFFNDDSYNVQEVRNVIQLFAGARAGGRLSVTFLRQPSAILEMKTNPWTDYDSDHAWLAPVVIEMVDNLCFVQKALQRPIRLPPGDIRAADVAAAHELAEIIRFGRTVERHERLSFTFSVHDVLRNLLEHLRGAETGTLLGLEQATDAAFVRLFGEQIPVGPMVRRTVGALDLSVEELDSFLAQSQEGDSLGIRLMDVQAIETFQDWQPQKLE